MNDDIIEALESTAPNFDTARIDPRATSNKREILTYRDTIMRFLEELDGDVSVSEVRLALDDYA